MSGNKLTHGDIVLDFADWVQENMPGCAENGCTSRVWEEGEKCLIHR